MRAGLRFRAGGLEVILSAAIIVLAVAACLQSVPALAVKARLTAVFITATTVRNDSAERFASTGAWPTPSSPTPARTDGTPQTAFAFEPAGAGMVARGTVGSEARPFAISFVPAVSEGGANVRWLCGRHRVPAGWQAVSAPRTFDLPYGAGYAACRDDGEGA